MKNEGIDRSRRRALVGALAWAGVAVSRSARAQQWVDDHSGRIRPPQPVPPIAVQCMDGSSKDLSSLLLGKATALQLIFTECTTICPMQGATFRRVQTLLPDQQTQSIQLVSLSIDPEQDTPQALRTWLNRFHAKPGWVAAVPGMKDLATMRGFFGDGQNPVANHVSQVQIIDRRGELIWRTYDLPSAESIAGILRRVSIASM